MRKIIQFVRKIIQFFRTVKLVLRYGEEVLLKDTLTKVYNRVLLKELARKEISRAERYKHKLCLLLIDVDNLKKINDEYGHLEGDKALKTIAEVLEGESREVDLLIRWGGDEFILIMPETKKSGPSLFIERVSEKLKKASEELDVSLSVTIGIMFWKEDLDLNTLIQKADLDLLKKKKGKKVWI
jgi:diguanylate cyclase (GGDEF)-like protein